MSDIQECFILTPQYDKHMIKKGKAERDNRGYRKFHPSAWGDCLRKMAFQYYGETIDSFKDKSPIDAKLQRTFEAGHIFHDRMQRLCAFMGILRGNWICKSCGKVHGANEKMGIFVPHRCDCQSVKDERCGVDLFEYKEMNIVDNEYNFDGHCDGIIELERGNPETRYVIDFKSIKSERFSILNKPEYKYVVQITIYMWFFGVDQGIIFYENKNDHQVKEFIVPLNQDLVDDIKTNAKKMMKILEQNKIPSIPRHYEENKSPCRWCGYKGICWKK